MAKGKRLVCASHVFAIDSTDYFETATRVDFVARATPRLLHFVSPELLQGRRFRCAIQTEKFKRSLK